MLCTVPGSGRGQLGLSCICANFFLFFYLLYRCLTLPRSDQMWCPVWPFSLSEFRSTPCGSGSECPSCGSSRAPVSSALWPASARRSRTLLRASEFRERERVRWAQMVQSCWEGFGCLGEEDPYQLSNSDASRRSSWRLPSSWVWRNVSSPAEYGGQFRVTDGQMDLLIVAYRFRQNCSLEQKERE